MRIGLGWFLIDGSIKIDMMMLMMMMIYTGNVNAGLIYTNPR